jgi:protein O-GlcNAc transferase
MTESQSVPGSPARILYEACPLCEGLDLGFLLSASCTRHPMYHPILPPLMTWKRCGACAHVFTDGYFTPEAAQIVFSHINENQQVGHDLERQRYVSARMVEKVLPWVSAGHWLDIGFGNASLLFTAREYGFLPVGTDLREENARRLAAHGIEVHCVDIHQLADDGRYAVISMADVLEHVPYPKQYLRSARRLLGEGGYLFLSMPNSECTVWTELDAAGTNPYWGELEHHHNFSRSRLYALLAEMGFEPVRYGVSERYRACMEVIARKAPLPGESPVPAT